MFCVLFLNHNIGIKFSWGLCALYKFYIVVFCVTTFCFNLPSVKPKIRISSLRYFFHSHLTHLATEPFAASFAVCMYLKCGNLKGNQLCS